MPLIGPNRVWTFLHKSIQPLLDLIRYTFTEQFETEIFHKIVVIKRNNQYTHKKIPLMH